MSNISIGQGDLGPTFGGRDTSGDEQYTAPREIAWWIPLVASAGALLALMVAGSVLFGQALETVISSL